MNVCWNFNVRSGTFTPAFLLLVVIAFKLVDLFFILSQLFRPVLLRETYAQLSARPLGHQLYNFYTFHAVSTPPRGTNESRSFSSHFNGNRSSLSPQDVRVQKTLDHMARKLNNQSFRESKVSFQDVHGALDAALITLTDASFEFCSLQLIASARHHNWSEAIFLLTINYSDLSSGFIEAIHQYDVRFIHTNATFDEWLDKKTSNRWFYRRLHLQKFRKMELFFNPALRKYRRLIYLDPDGLISSSLKPMLQVHFPRHVSIIMRQNDRSFQKNSLWGNEINVNFLSKQQKAILIANYPDRDMSGSTSWFIVDVSKLPTPKQLFSMSMQIVCTFRAGFRLNDQTLLNFLFYRNLALMPWCSSAHIPVINDVRNLTLYCLLEKRRQYQLHGKLRFMYRHMSSLEKRTCINLAATPIMKIKSRGKQHVPEKQNSQRLETILQESALEKPFLNGTCVDALRKWRARNGF